MKHSIFDMVLGGGYYELDLHIPTESPEDLVTDHGNAYIYTHIRFPLSVTWHAGLSADWFDSDELESS